MFSFTDVGPGAAAIVRVDLDAGQNLIALLREERATGHSGTTVSQVVDPAVMAGPLLRSVELAVRHRRRWPRPPRASPVLP